MVALCVLTKTPITGYVLRAFDKFFNYGESEAVSLNWHDNNVTVLEKIDGSLIKIWYDRDNWHISTNGTINAFTCSCGENTNFGEVFTRVLRERYNYSSLDDFFHVLDMSYTYIFELISVQNPIVVQYNKEDIYYLGRRNIKTMREDRNGKPPHLPEPRHYNFNSLHDCLLTAHDLDASHEGYVCLDSHFNRIKIKGNEYLRLHRIRHNGHLTPTVVVELWQNDILDDYVTNFPHETTFIQSVIDKLETLMTTTQEAYDDTMSYHPSTRADLAKLAKRFNPLIMQYHFQMTDHKINNVIEFYQHVPTRIIVAHL